LAGVDFAISRPVPRVAIQRLLSSDSKFWLDHNESDTTVHSFDDTNIGAKILVAEDNPVNQKLITEVLRIFNCDLTLVENGKEAVLMNEKDHFDLILMDCQMPEMDGFQATGIIRAQEQESAAKEGVVIVALTANARQEDRERCIASGMDDYLSKPFTMAQLRDMILKWHHVEGGDAFIADNSSTAPVDEGDDSASPGDDDLLDPNILNGIRALQNPHSPNLLEQLIEIYRSTAPALLQTLDTSIQGEDYDEIRELAHSLKSSSGNIGARKIFELSARLEEMGRDKEIDGASEILVEIEQMYPKVCELLDQEVRRSAA
jgi:CheY-like chemotaxis protein